MKAILKNTFYDKCVVVFNETDTGCDYVITDKKFNEQIRGSINYRNSDNTPLNEAKMQELAKLVLMKHDIKTKECVFGTCPPLFQ